MNIAPRFLGRGSWLASRDPRLLVLIVVAYIITVIQIWDGRLIFLCLLLALVYYRTARIPFASVRRNWIAALTLLTIVVLVNTVLTGDRLAGVEVHPFFTIPLFGTVVSAESLAYAGTQWMRYVGMVAVGFPVAFCIAPADLGVTFARLGVPEKFAVGVDLTFRFLPSLAAEYQQTIDAQRIRGYDPGGGGSPIKRLRRMGPLMAPLTVNAIAGAEDTIDAMDLRGFGTGKRSWLRHLRFDRMDRFLLVLFFALAAVTTLAGFTTGVSDLWTPQVLIDLASR
ncbi:MAG TPA: energy-coupling factor transporter transmembrane component T [Candidatus Limnocylindrales bacterium]|nr:energy-coupling factor transporter transmembrane component T [Candidatus Limnocylindrales bacterium]